MTGTIPFLYRSFMKGTVMYRYLYRSNTGSFYKRNGTSTGTRTVQYWSITDPWQRFRNGNFKGSSVPFRYRSLPFRSVPVPVHCTGVQIPPMVITHCCRSTRVFESSTWFRPKQKQSAPRLPGTFLCWTGWWEAQTTSMTTLLATPRCCCFARWTCRPLSRHQRSPRKVIKTVL